MEFAIRHMTTEKHWDEILLNSSTRSQIDQLRSSLQQHKNISDAKNKLPDGFGILFLGPDGTDKSLAAAILAKEFGAEVYKVDLSKLVSKYIGETEKNLNALFERAETNGWILFFDEADALFGKRANVKDAHDRYANQEVSYLLQKIENHHGLVIVASNLKKNIDAAFLRRFRSVINFPLPKPRERKRIK